MVFKLIEFSQRIWWSESALSALSMELKYLVLRNALCLHWMNAHWMVNQLKFNKVLLKRESSLFFFFVYALCIFRPVSFFCLSFKSNIAFYTHFMHKCICLFFFLSEGKYRAKRARFENINRKHSANVVFKYWQRHVCSHLYKL